MSDARESEPYVPLSVREGGRRARLDWWWRGRREALALRLAPWFRFVGPKGMAAWDLSQQRACRVLELEVEVDQLRSAARDVICAADLAYGHTWRDWQKGGPQGGAVRLSKTLTALDALAALGQEGAR